MADLNYNFECDWLIELSHNKLSGNKLTNNKLSDNNLAIKEIVIFLIKKGNCFVVFYSMDQSISFLAEPGTVSKTISQ